MVRERNINRPSRYGSPVDRLEELFADAADDLPPVTNSILPPHRRHKRSKYHKDPAERPFVVWDGEGVTEVPGDPQKYVLFGCFNGEEHSKITARSLSTKQLLDFIIDMGHENPDAIHVGFAFGYDVNMILKDLQPKRFRRLKDTNKVMAYGYRLEHIPGKWFRVSEEDGITVTIQDIFGFFQTSLVKALKKNIPDHPLMERLAEIEAGKDRRSDFGMDEMEYITKYWEIENELLHALVTELRNMMYDPRVNLKITKWYGPGALASYTYRTRGIDKHKAETPEQVYEAARYAYAGGRFELFRAGRHENVYGLDINSAYPNAISRLPSMSEGYWRHVENPTEVVEFGVYHLKIASDGIALRMKTPGPVFHRDRAHNISFPWAVEGWYWSPEITQVLSLTDIQKNVKILEGWEYVGWETRPFEFVRDLYEQRKRMKEEEIGAEMAIKLCLNSLYGKMAQRTGWERTGGAPQWHQLEWAGWVTSYTRAQLYEVIKRIPWEHLIAVETDGIYTTATPESLGIEHSKDLGEWDVSRHDEMFYLQSGVYAMRDGKEWSLKYRGLDANSVSPEKIAMHTRRMRPMEKTWPPLVGSTTRFIGYGLALQKDTWNEGQFKRWHRVWDTDPAREIKVGSAGKRQHRRKLCTACRAGLTAYQMPHDLFITSRAFEMSQSFMHPIPWLDKVDTAEQMREMYQPEECYVH